MTAPATSPTVLERALPARDRLRPGPLWWLVALPAVGVGGYGLALQDARAVTDAVPGLPWLDEAHFAAGGLALLIGPLAFRRDLLARATRWHHRVGWLYVAGVLVSGIAGLLMACWSMAGPVTHFGFGTLAVLWLGTTGLGVRAIQRRDVVAHRRWMVLSFALCFAAVTLRIQLGPLAVALAGFEPAYRIVSWSCWVPNLLVAWWWLLRTDVTGRTRRA